MQKYLSTHPKVNISKVLLFGLSFVFVNVFVYYFISQEKYIYFWDYYHYWEKYQRISSLFIHDPLGALKELQYTISHDDYNLLPVFFLIPYHVLFGPPASPTYFPSPVRMHFLQPLCWSSLSINIFLHRIRKLLGRLYCFHYQRSCFSLITGYQSCLGTPMP